MNIKEIVRTGLRLYPQAVLNAFGNLAVTLYSSFDV